MCSNTVCVGRKQPNNQTFHTCSYEFSSNKNSSQYLISFLVRLQNGKRMKKKVKYGSLVAIKDKIHNIRQFFEYIP